MAAKLREGEEERGRLQQQPEGGGGGGSGQKRKRGNSATHLQVLACFLSRSPNLHTIRDEKSTDNREKFNDSSRSSERSRGDSAKGCRRAGGEVTV